MNHGGRKFHGIVNYFCDIVSAILKLLKNTDVFKIVALPKACLTSEAKGNKCHFKTPFIEKCFLNWTYPINTNIIPQSGSFEFTYILLHNIFKCSPLHKMEYNRETYSQRILHSISVKTYDG